MSGVDQCLDAPSCKFADQALYGEDQGGRARRVAHQGDSGAWASRFQDRGNDLVRRLDRKRDPRDAQMCARPLRHETQRVQRCVVLVVGGEQLVSRAERRRDRAQDRVDAARRVGDEGQVFEVGAEVRPERRPSRFELSWQVGREEADRIAFHTLAPSHLGLEHRHGARSEAPVIEEGDARIEEPVTRDCRVHPRSVPVPVPPSRDVWPHDTTDFAR